MDQRPSQSTPSSTPGPLGSSKDGSPFAGYGAYGSPRGLNRTGASSVYSTPNNFYDSFYGSDGSEEQSQSAGPAHGSARGGRGSAQQSPYGGNNSPYQSGSWRGQGSGGSRGFHQPWRQHGSASPFGTPRGRGGSNYGNSRGSGSKRGMNRDFGGSPGAPGGGYYLPSMMQDPWARLEARLDASKS